METDEPSGSVSETLAEESSDDDEENSSPPPPRVSELASRKHNLEFAGESAGAGKDDPSNAPCASAAASGPTPTPDSSVLEDMEVIDVAPLAYQPPPPAKKPRLSKRWNIYAKVPVINVECDR